MRALLDTALAVAAKDLAIELKSGESLVATALFAVVVTLVATFALDLGNVAPAAAAAGTLWLAVTLAGTLAVSRLFAREREGGVFTALLMTPAPRAGLYLGKLVALLVVLLVVEALLLPLVGLFFQAPLGAAPLTLAAVLVLGALGYAAVGALFGAMSLATRTRELLLGPVLFPLVTPLVICAAAATRLLLGGSGAGDWLQILVVLDVVFVTGGLWLFGPLVED